MQSYSIKKTPNKSFNEIIRDTIWQTAETAVLDNFRPEGSDHRPKATVKLLYNHDGIFGFFHVKDQYVKCIHTQFGDPVYTDSCVEFFVKPNQGMGYFNFEFNCGGTLLSSYITDPTRTKNGFNEFILLPPKHGDLVKISSSLPSIVNPEITETVTWHLFFFIPFKLLELYIGALTIREWTGNFYKCGDNTSHPHWVSWSPVKELNFHTPECFGNLIFK